MSGKRHLATVDIRNASWRRATPQLRIVTGAVLALAGPDARLIGCRTWSRVQWLKVHVNVSLVRDAIAAGLLAWHGEDLVVEVALPRSVDELKP